MSRTTLFARYMLPGAAVFLVLLILALVMEMVQ